MIDENRARKYCKDDISKIENYDKAIADNTQTWFCHHRLELTLDGEFAHSKEELIRFGMYYNRPYFELIFLTPEEHGKLHNPKGEKHPNYGKKLGPMSEEHKAKISAANKDKKRSPETKANISAGMKGKKRGPYKRKALAPREWKESLDRLVRR